MKVAVVCPYSFDAHGGVQDQVGRLVGWLREEGHGAWAVAPGSGGPEGTRHVGGYVSWRANRSRAPISVSPAAVGRVRRAVADADVVHVHEPLMPMVSLGALFGKGPPRVGTFHADPGRVARWAYRWGRLPLRRLTRRLAVVTAVSEVAAAAIEPFATPTIVPNGIDLERYGGGQKTPGRVVFVGRPDERKGLDVLLDAWPDVVARHPQVTLRVVGSEGSAPGVTFLGRVAEDAKVMELKEAAVLVAPNRGGESFGIVVLEGMAAGCAAVVSDLAAFRAVAAEAARYVPVGESEALTDALVEVIESPSRVAEMGRAGSERATLFGKESVLGGYLEAYELALAAGRGDPPTR